MSAKKSGAEVAGCWSRLSKPPESALKKIQAGRLKGKTDINPMWRYKAMTSEFGQCGIGWRFDIANQWSEDGSDGQKFAFAKIHLYTKNDAGDEWSAPIPGVGGSMMVAKETRGLHANDEAYKMAVTDALGTAMKMLGMASSIYEGLWDGSKYLDQPVATKPPAAVFEAENHSGAEITKAAEEYSKGPAPAEELLDDVPTDDSTVSGDHIVTIKAINVKNGESKKGPWTKTSFVCVEGENWYSTFSKTHGKLISDAGKGGKLAVEYEEDKYGRNITDLAVLETK